MAQESCASSNANQTGMDRTVRWVALAGSLLLRIMRIPYAALACRTT